MTIDNKLVDFVYGREKQISSIFRRAVIPGGLIVNMNQMLQREEAYCGQNTPRRVIGLTSAVVIDVVKTGMYAGASLLSYYA
ncbi:MAG: hypothetical protein AABX60_03825 [Nanoarchaeota archaeon]